MIIRDATGQPTGIFVDNAIDLVLAHVPPSSDEEMMTYLQKGIEICQSVGLTSIHYAGVDEQMIRVMKQAIDSGKMDLRVYAMLRGGVMKREDWCNKKELDYHDRLTIRSVKLFMDGALGSRGAALLQPYEDQPDTSGLLLMSPDELFNETLAWVLAISILSSFQAI